MADKQSDFGCNSCCEDCVPDLDLIELILAVAGESQATHTLCTLLET